MSIELNKEETESLIDGLVYVVAQAENQLLKSESISDKNIRDHVCDYQVRKVQYLRTLKTKLSQHLIYNISNEN